MPLAAEFEQAKAACKAIFENLPDTPEKQSVLIALGLMGKSTLKRKVRYRAQGLVETIGDLLPDLALVTDEAINCRNYYVHGTKLPRFDYDANFEARVFFTEALEFVFVASELVECGWDVRSWFKTHSGITHPVGHFVSNYSDRLRMLKDLLPKKTLKI